MEAQLASDPLGLLGAPEKKAAMLIFNFGRDSDIRERLAGLLGAQRLGELESELEGQAEALRFRFEAEVGEHSTPEAIAADMLGDIEREVSRERLRHKFLP